MARVHKATDQAAGVAACSLTINAMFEPDEWRRILAILANLDTEWIVASGSLPRGVPADLYAQAGTIATERGQKFVLDTSGPALHTAVGHGLELLKLSLGELEFAPAQRA
jgi:6-phosphofructokinase 2